MSLDYKTYSILRAQRYPLLFLPRGSQLLHFKMYSKFLHNFGCWAEIPAPPEQLPAACCPERHSDSSLWMSWHVAARLPPEPCLASSVSHGASAPPAFHVNHKHIKQIPPRNSCLCCCLCWKLAPQIGAHGWLLPAMRAQSTCRLSERPPTQQRGAPQSLTMMCLLISSQHLPPFTIILFPSPLAFPHNAPPPSSPGTPLVCSLGPQHLQQVPHTLGVQ